MLSIAKVHSQGKQAAAKSAAGYLGYLGLPPPKDRGFESYARGDGGGPAPVWACRGASLLGLSGEAEAEQIERLAMGLHPATSEPLVVGAGRSHVAGLDMTFSAPKDVSAAFAGADEQTREELLACVTESAKAALAHAETLAVTRHGAGGKAKRLAEAAVAACFVHFASRGARGGEPQPQLHVHGLLFNVGKESGGPSWRALEHRPMFDSKMALGILFRAELASRLAGLGFEVVPDGPYFTLSGISDAQREALSDRSREINELMATGKAGSGYLAERAAATSSRQRKDEPPLPELLESFQAMAGALGITPESVAAMRVPAKRQEPFAIDRDELLADLTAQQSCSTPSEALRLICERAMGRWSAAQCLEELDAFLTHERVVHLGRTELLSSVFTSQATLELEASISARVAAGKASGAHRIDASLVHAEFDRMEASLRSKLGVAVSLSQQREAALHVACGPSTTAFVEGWAGAGKTTMLRATAKAYEAEGFEVRGCCQSAAAAQNLSREAGIPSRTVASLLLASSSGKSTLGPRTVLVLDEAGMVGSREFSLLQEAAMKSGAKLVCVGDARQLQPIEAGGIFASLCRIHGSASISNIQRQRTDFEPLLAWLSSRPIGRGGVSKEMATTLRGLPDEARLQALEAMSGADLKLGRALDRWRLRFDYEWMRVAVEALAKGEAATALSLLEAKGRLNLSEGRERTMDVLMRAWAADKTPVAAKAIVAATRMDVAELNRRAREILVQSGAVRDELGIEAQIIHRDESVETLRFAPGDRIVFTMNDRGLGVVNGGAGTIRELGDEGFGPILMVELDDANERGEKRVQVPAAFGRFAHAYCSTTFKAQGRTFDSAHVYVDPTRADREWSYVAASRSRFATTLHVDSSGLAASDPEAHTTGDASERSRAELIGALGKRMSRSRAKGTTLDHEPPAVEREESFAAAAWSMATAFVARLRERARGMEREQ